MVELKIVLSIKDDILHDLIKACDAYYLFLHALNTSNPAIKAFYGQGESLEDALKNKIFDIDGYVTADARDYLSEHLPYATSLWDGNIDESMSIMFSGIRDNTNIMIDLEQHKDIYNSDSLQKMFNAVANKFTINYFLVFHSSNSCVFTDRLDVGWMIYLPITDDVSAIEAAERIEDINVKGNKGKLFIVKDDYDFLNEDHRIASNELEIDLTNSGLLPFYKDI